MMLPVIYCDLQKRSRKWHYIILALRHYWEVGETTILYSAPAERWPRQNIEIIFDDIHAP